jgi:hypothetical protein
VPIIVIVNSGGDNVNVTDDDTNIRTIFFGVKKNARGIDDLMEARVGIEPTYKGFADLSLTTWVPRLGSTV